MKLTRQECTKICGILNVITLDHMEKADLSDAEVDKLQDLLLALDQREAENVKDWRRFYQENDVPWKQGSFQPALIMDHAKKVAYDQAVEEFQATKFDVKPTNFLSRGKIFKLIPSLKYITIVKPVLLKK